MNQAKAAAEIRNLRETSKKTLAEVAKAAEISVSYLSEIETGRKVPSHETLETLLTVLNASEQQKEAIRFGFSPGAVARAILFIDGKWLRARKYDLAKIYGSREAFRMDLAKLPEVLPRRLSVPHQILRTVFFNTIPVNYDLAIDDDIRDARTFHTFLETEHHFRVRLVAQDYAGRHEPPAAECCQMDVELAAELLFTAAVPYSCDTVVFVGGREIFRLPLERAQSLGKRVAVVSIKQTSHTAWLTASPKAVDEILWLDDILGELELTYKKHRLQCVSPLHIGDPSVWTDFQPRADQRFYCERCRKEFREQVQALRNEVNVDSTEKEKDEYEVGEALKGVVSKLITAKGYGFVRKGDDQFFFHLTDVADGVDFFAFKVGDPVRFKVKKRPSGSDARTSQKAGAALDVRPDAKSNAPNTESAGVVRE